MNIQIDGVNTVNKGAELMLCSVINEIEKKYPKANVYVNLLNESDLTFLKTNLNVRQRYVTKHRRYFIKLAKIFGVEYAYFTTRYVFKKIDLLLDAGGFQFSDQFFNNWKHKEEQIAIEENYYKKLKKNNTKIFLLPQAFGPFETETGKKILGIINEYSTVLVAREQKSFNYLLESGVSEKKLFKCTDFTLNVKVEKEEANYNSHGKVCIIPNKKMITHTSNNLDDYLSFVKVIVNEFKKRGIEAFLLNHEGPGDLIIAEKINELFSNKLDVLTNLNAYQVKSIIGNSSYIVTSRFHGLASALNQAIPCLASSWSHKYELLFEDYNLKDKIIDINMNRDLLKGKINNLIDNEATIKQELEKSIIDNRLQVKNMWETIWKLV